MQPPTLGEQICCVRQNLESQSFDGLLVSDQVRWLGLIVKNDKKCPTEFLSQWETLNALLVHASRCRDYSLLEGETVESRHEPLHAWQQICHYPKCERGKVLYRHVSACSRSACLLCQSMRHLVKFHAEACSDSNCRIPRCSEFKEKRKRRLIKNELRLKQLRRNERRLRQLYMPESLPAAAKVNCVCKKGKVIGRTIMMRISYWEISPPCHPFLLQRRVERKNNRKVLCASGEVNMHAFFPSIILSFHYPSCHSCD